MNKHWLTVGLVVLGYAVLAVGLSYYQTIPSNEEKTAQYVTPVLINTNPVTDEIAGQLSEKEQYGEQPIEVDGERLGKFNPFRL